MSALFYIVISGVKNSIRELFRKPGKLILYLLVIAAIVVSAIASVNIKAAEGGLSRDWLRGVYFAFLVFFLVITVQKGTHSGDEIFEMNDVNLLFVAPINPRSILLYGLVKLAKVSFFAGFFILFQSANLAQFGVRFDGVLILFFMFVLNTVVLTVLSLVIYSTTNGNPRRKRAVKLIAVAVFIPMLLFFAIRFFTLGDPLAALNATLASPVLSAVPFAGWTATAAVAFVGGETLTGLLWIGLLLLSGAGLLVFLMRSRADYYEDVLVATETAFEKKRAAAEGDLNAMSAVNTKVRVKKTGISGLGASVFFYKHLRETFRQNRFGFFSLTTIILTLTFLVLAFFMSSWMDSIFTLQMLMWMQVFMIGTGRGLKEVYSHYIFLVPETSFKKLLWSNMEVVFKTLLESVLFFVIPGIILWENPLLIFMAMLVYTFFSLFLLGVNYLSMRFTGANISNGLLMLIYFVAVIVGLLPGLIPALIAGFSVGGLGGKLIGLLILGAWELAAALGCFALSKDVLHSCDMPTMNQFGK